MVKNYELNNQIYYQMKPTHPVLPLYPVMCWKKANGIIYTDDFNKTVIKCTWERIQVVELQCIK